jgi:signal transduction histidine kinase
VILRSISEVRRRLDDRGRMTAELVRSGISPEAVLRIDALRSEVARLRPTLPRLDALARSEREDAMAAWLAEAGVADPWLVAATFVDAGVDEAALARVLGDAPADARRAALSWLETSLAAQTLFASAEQAAERIASLVESVKAYTHMDRARDMVDVDVHQGLESTIALFATRLQEKGVILEREYAHALPKIRAYPGDLNQVWGHLIDNALDAVVPGAGRITVRTGVEEGAVVVEIRDNGSGIPPELQDRVWEPFFTTKAIGKGTGLGLDIARRIVVDQHGGELVLTSSPGDTRFTVRLPLTTISTFGI